MHVECGGSHEKHIQLSAIYNACYDSPLIQQFHTLRLAQSHVAAANQIVYVGIAM